MRKLMFSLAALALLAVAAWAISSAIRDDAGDTAYDLGVTGEGTALHLTTDATGRLWVHIGATEAEADTLTFFDKAVATPDTALPLVASATNVRAIWMVAKRAGAANAGTVYIRGSTVDKDDVQGISLAPGDYFEIPIPAGTTIDLNTVYIDADNATDGVTGGYITE